ncbi:MAG: SPOR domain-containing protein [Flavobacteriales bacterium]|nr:SPOR domain-containing protein [Flavobacteriales bacterium]
MKYLIGVCYAEEEIVNPKTLELLNQASAKASLEYDPNSLEEERVPIYVYYYLSLAYAQNKMCEKAEKFREKFLEIYPHDDTYYIDESLRWLKKCYGMRNQPVEVALPKFPDFKPYVSKLEKKSELVTSKEIVIDTSEVEVKPQEPRHILTQRLEYSTEIPLYGVQLGAFKEVVPVSRFKKMKNVDAFMDKNGWIRYVVGHFSIYSQAESLLKVIQSQGYLDAFVVNVNNEKKFAEEVISVNNVNIRAKPSRMEYRIQIGAFKEEISDESAKLYLKIEGIREHRERELTFLTVGKFKTYLEAKAYSEGIRDAGIEDAFVVAIANGKKAPLEQVIEFKK